jgi:hypothetical protein
MKKLVLIAALLMSTFVFAEEHSLSFFRGGDVDLKAYDHSVAGSIGESLVFASNDEATGITTYVAKKEGKIITTEIKKHEDGQFGTELNYVTAEGEQKSISVLWKALNRAENKYVFTMNGQDVAVYVKAEGMDGEHFINPQYDFQFADGKTLSVKLENGTACYGLSANFITIILTSYSIL